jgi:hypothetical protein
LSTRGNAPGKTPTRWYAAQLVTGWAEETKTPGLQPVTSSPARD